MSFNPQEKADIIFQLGWPGKTLIPNSTDYSKIVADRLENLTPEIENNVRRLLDSLIALDVSRTEAICRLSAKRVGDIETNEYELECLMREKKRILRELSDTLDLEIMRQGSGGVGICV